MCGGDEFKVGSIGGDLDISEFGSAALGWIKVVQTRGLELWLGEWGIGDDNDSYLNHDDFTIVWLKFLDR